MIENPNKEELEALASLEHNAHFKNIMNWLHKSLERTLESCVDERDQVALRHSQGSAQTLISIFNHAGEARKNIERLKR